MNTTQQITRRAPGLARRLVELRRDFHRHPETAFKEVRTSGKVADVLGELGMAVRTGVGRTGVVGLLRGKGRRTLALRADMDALPIDEANDVPYRSSVKGVMHACGHDANTAMLLGAAMLLAPMRDRLKGNVKFLFQPAEEIISGAKAMIGDGALARPKPNAFLAVHLVPGLPFGSVGLRAGPMMAASDNFRITIVGRGGHGASPHKTVDPLAAATHLAASFNTIRRNVDGFEQYVLSLCAIRGGRTYNIIPQSAEMMGTLRTFKASVRTQIVRRMRAILKGAEETFGVTCRLAFEVTCPVLNQDAGIVKMVESAAVALKMPTTEAPVTMGSEDFACFLERGPGAIIRLGTQRTKQARVLHNDRFTFDERILPKGAALVAQCAVAYLAGR